MKIAGEEIELPLILAPMAGVTDVGFRAVASFFGADVTVSEMLSARAMFANPTKTQYMTLTTEQEKVKIAQIFGHEPEFMQMAVQSPLLEKFNSFDINMGCPAPKIIKNGEGASLMDNLSLASKIISTCKKATTKQVSVKFRKGYRTENFLEFAKMCEDSGADYVTFHARTVAQGYSGTADYDAIATVKAKLHIPVIGNGDVFDEKSLKLMCSTGVDGVMIGRGSLGKPWIFAELSKDKIKNYDKGFLGIENIFDSKGKITNLAKFQTVKKHIEILREKFDEKWLENYIRKHFLWYARELSMTASVRNKLATCDNIDECLKILQSSWGISKD